MNRQSDFLKLIEAHRGILIKVSRIYFDDPQDQEELRQEIISRLWESYKSFRGDSKFSSWMYRVALNTAITFFKKTSSRREVSLDYPDSIFHVEADQAAGERVAEFYRAVHSLDRIEKALIFLFIEGCSHREIGEQLGISEGNARVKLVRVKSKLKTMLGKHDDEV